VDSAHSVGVEKVLLGSVHRVGVVITKNLIGYKSSNTKVGSGMQRGRDVAVTDIVEAVGKVEDGKGGGWIIVSLETGLGRFPVPTGLRIHLTVGIYVGIGNI
jgi:hypothetical protein